MSMVEKVARAIAAADGYDIDGLRAHAEAGQPHAKADLAQLMKQAKAAAQAVGDSFDDPVIRAAITAALEE